MQARHVYGFRVSAVEGARVGPASLVATIALNTAPSQPVITSILAGVGSANVAWAAPSNNTAAIEVQSRIVVRNGTGWNTIATLAGNSASYTNTGLAAGTVVQYRVRASNPRGTTNWSAASATVTVR